jgi:hypothetical protein
MDALAAATRTADVVAGLPAGFMLDAATYERGGKAGFDGVDFYFAGRGGVLGDVEGPVVAAALVFFEPTTVVAAWERGRAVRPPQEAAAEFAGCCHDWAEAHLADGVDYGRLAQLLGAVRAAASPAGAPLFAGWAAMEEPSRPKALALHRLNLLRELRGAMHGGAILAEGLSPLEALSVRTPFMAALFGWGEPLADAETHKAAWERAEEGTNRAMARHFAVLSDAERDELVELCAAAQGG